MPLAHLIDPPDREQDRMRDEDHDAISRFMDAARRCAARSRPIQPPAAHPLPAANGR